MKSDYSKWLTTSNVIALCGFYLYHVFMNDGYFFRYNEIAAEIRDKSDSSSSSSSSDEDDSWLNKWKNIDFDFSL